MIYAVDMLLLLDIGSRTGSTVRCFQGPKKFGTSDRTEESTGKGPNARQPRLEAVREYPFHKFFAKPRKKNPRNISHMTVAIYSGIPRF